MRKVLLGVLFVIITSAAFYFLFYVGKAEEILIKEEELVAAESEELQLRARVSSLRKIEARLVEYRDAVNQMNASIPADPDMDLLILELNQLAVDSGVTWASGTWTVPADPDPTGVRNINVSMTISGQYFEVLGYLYGISEMDRLIRIESLAFSPTLDETGFNILGVNIAATTFTTGSVVVPAPPELEDATQESDAATTTTTVAGDDGDLLDTTTTTVEG